MVTLPRFAARRPRRGRFNDLPGIDDAARSLVMSSRARPGRSEARLRPCAGASPFVHAGACKMYITARIRAVKIYHGYDEDLNPVITDHPPRDFVEKVIKLDRILSFTEDYIFIECPHDTVQTWEYEGSLADIKKKLQDAKLLAV
jgi:hypothetical protein